MELRLPGAQFSGDPVFRCAVFLVVTEFLADGVGVALLACWLPARREGRLGDFPAGGTRRGAWGARRRVGAWSKETDLLCGFDVGGY